MNEQTNTSFQNWAKSFVVEPVPTGSTLVNVNSTERVVSAFSGALLSVYALRNPTPTRLLLGAVGLALLNRGITGYSSLNTLFNREDTSEELRPIEITQVISVNKPRKEMYRYWRKLENLPIFMKHLKSVTQLDPRRSRWVATTPAKILNLEWEAEILQDKENELISWRSVPGSDVDNSGEVRFKTTPDGKGTEIQAIIKYIAPAGHAGEAVAKLFNSAFEKLLRADLLRFKQIMESNGAALPEEPSKKETELQSNADSN